MSLDHRLIDLLVCPLCKGPLEMQRDADQRPSALVCPADRLAFPIRDGIPVMLESEARAVDPAASAALNVIAKVGGGSSIGSAGSGGAGSHGASR